MTDITNTQQLMIFATLELTIFIAGVLLIWVQQRKQTQLIEKIILDPEYAAAVATNCIFGFIDGLDTTNKKGKDLELAKLRQAQLFGFINVCGQAAFGTLGNVAKQMPKKLQGYLGFAEQFASLFGVDLKGIIAKKGTQVVSEAAGLPPALR